MRKAQETTTGGRLRRAAALSGVVALTLGSAPSIAESPAAPTMAARAGGDIAATDQLAERLADAPDGLSFTLVSQDGAEAAGADPVPAHGGTDQALPVDAAGEDETAFAEPPIDKTSERVLRIGTADELIAVFEGIGFSYVDVRDAGREVPRLQVAGFPGDIGDLDTLFLRKSAFFNTLLPIVLQINESIMSDRRRLLDLRARIGEGEPVTPEDERFLDDLAERYQVGDRDLDDLAVRVDIIPPSMALAMAAVESGWGTSALARRGNALFGQITSSGQGIEASTGHTYATFATLRDSVLAYAMNLNTHGAYLEFRAMRRIMREAGDTPDGYRLMGALQHYSELGNRYIAYVRRVMQDDELHRIDGARLAPAGDPGQPS